MSTKPRTKSLSKKSLANEVVAVLLAAGAVLLLLSLVTYDPRDPSANSAGPNEPSNLIGVLGAYLSDFVLQLFGLAAFIIPFLLALIAYRSFFADSAAVPARKAVGAALLLIALSGFLALFPQIEIAILEHIRNGGVIGFLVEGVLAKMLNNLGAAIVLTAASILTLILTMEISLAALGRRLRSIKEQRVSERAAAEPTMLSRAGAWLLSWLAHRRQQAVEARQARIEERRILRDERERERRERQAEALKRIEDDRMAEQIRFDAQDELQRRERERGAQPAYAGSTPIKTEVASDPQAASNADVQPSRTGFDIRREAAAAVRAYAAKAEQSKSGDIGPDDVTMDPDVAEMISTASIVRTPPTDRAGAGGAIRGKEPSRRKHNDAIFGSTFRLPGLDLLEAPIGHQEQAEEELRERATILAEKCKEFAVTGHIHRINPGPVVTTFEFKPDPGIKYSRVVGLAEDLCLALKAESIRIDRIPGKSTVGIEAPNLHRERICLRDIIESIKFQQSDSKLTVALGKTINGEEYVTDLCRMPHLLIAGATGAGKSVTLNAIICSILYKASPEEVKLILVDPKRVELGLYEGIPHLLAPIVTDPKRAANALRWAVNEMEERYRVLATLGVRNIEQYNRQVREMVQPSLYDDAPAAYRPLPYIVLAIDELADLMMVARGDVETSIARLAQMARAVGIHLVLATQRPSVDIITGVIKANIPSRIAFRVSSKVDSRTIIDSNGAEALLGQGDMLFLPPGTSRLIRVHGSFVNEAEIRRITEHTRAQAEPSYNEQVTMSEQESQDSEGFDAVQDELFDEALQIVIDMGRASTSVLQRRLSIGYGRAAKILDSMHRQGLIGPADGSKPRKVLQAAFEFRERVAEMLEERAE